jgi:hypothetical protein
MAALRKAHLGTRQGPDGCESPPLQWRHDVAPSVGDDSFTPQSAR